VRVSVLDEKQKKLVRDRLSRVQGQIGGVLKMVEADRYCVDILNQTSAIVSAIRNVENLVLENHLNTCVADAMRSNDLDEQNEKTTEVMNIIGTYRR
jgi:DNA-binding FrmR family transcriptional regulator